MRIGKLVRSILIIFLYASRSLLGPSNCRFLIGCTEFAAGEIQDKRLDKAFWSICKRLLSCNPLSRFLTRYF